MSEERKRILSMLAEGKITAEEAEQLLIALHGDNKQAPIQKEAKFLRIKVWEEGKEKVNVNVPLSLAKLAMKFIPEDSKNQMANQNIDLDFIIREIQNGASAGKIVEVVDDGDRVEIYLD